jgi:hypothetical protein
MKIDDLPEYVNLKEGVEIEKISKYIFGYLFFTTIYRTLRQDITITSGSETIQHSSHNSAHYKGQAVDLRIRDWIVGGCDTYSYKWWLEIKSRVFELAYEMPDYVFILEKDHLHIQIGSIGINKYSTNQITDNLYIDDKMIFNTITKV